MKQYLLYIVLLFISIQQIHSQEDGVVALNLPVRNSLKFNRYAINPTFSFVREQNRYISFTNKREWVQFDDAPQTYLFSYSGRFRENIGVGLGLFQQNYGVLTTFGGALNFAYNVVIDREQNLTFGTNIGVYKSGINKGNIITNFPDPSLQNIPSNTLITINPGINYGTSFFDFGVSINNLALFNFTNSTLIEENPEQSVQGHIMYTGYVNSRGFFDESKFSGLVRSEFKKNQTVLSGIMMLTVPKGIWAQVGYNTLYGVSGGLGLNITNQIALEYNYEKSIGDLSSFGNSHEITLAYKFNNQARYNYSGDDEEAFLIPKKKRTVASRKPTTNRPPKSLNTNKVDNITDVNEQAKLKAEEEARVEAENKAKIEAETEAKRLAEAAKAKAAEEEKLRLQTEEQTRLELQNKAKEEAEAEDKRLANEARAKAALEEQVRLQAEAQAKLQAEADAKQLEEARLEAVAEEQARLEAEKKVREDALKQIDTVQLDGVLVPIARDREAQEMQSLTELTEKSKIEQLDLLKRLRETVVNRQQDLDDLKEENDLGEQGIYKEPKPFKSISAENAALEGLKLEIDGIIQSQNEKISELENLYNERLKNVSDRNDEVNVYYLNAIEILKSEQSQAVQTKKSLLSTLDDVKVATEFERKRRIKRAAYDNEEARYTKDRAALNVIKQNTIVSNEPLQVDDFDFGEELSNNIQIVKDVTNTENGYYLVIAVHEDVTKRDDFLTKVISSGKSDVDFFYDVNTSKYYIYSHKFDDLESAKSTMESKNNAPYNSKMSMVKIEN